MLSARQGVNALAAPLAAPPRIDPLSTAPLAAPIAEQVAVVTRQQRLLLEAAEQLREVDEDEDVEETARRRHTCRQLLLQVARNSQPGETVERAMGTLWASGWDEEDEAELQAAASGNASRRLEIERREARGAQRGAQHLREEAREGGAAQEGGASGGTVRDAVRDVLREAQRGAQRMREAQGRPPALEPAPMAAQAQLVAASASLASVETDPYSVVSVCARHFTGACFGGVHVASVGGSAPARLAPAAAGSSGSDAPHPPATSAAEAARPAAAAAAAEVAPAEAYSANTVAAEAAAAAAELAALPEPSLQGDGRTFGARGGGSGLVPAAATSSSAAPGEVAPVIGSAAAAAAAAEATAAKARPQGRQSAAQLQRRLQAALEMHMTITQTEVHVQP